MNRKYLIIVSLMLAILTIGAASATQDADDLAVDEDLGDAVDTPQDVDIIADDDDDEGDNDDEGDDEEEEEVFDPIDIPSNPVYKSDQNITFEVEEDVNGIVRISNQEVWDDDAGEYVHNYTDFFNVNNGKGSYSIKDYEIGSYPLHFKFESSDAPQDTVDKINEYFEDSYFTLNVYPMEIPECVYIQDDVIIKFSVPEGVDGNVTVYYAIFDEDLCEYITGAEIARGKLSDGEINLGKFTQDTEIYINMTNESGVMYEDLLNYQFQVETSDDNPDWIMKLESFNEILKSKESTLHILDIPDGLDGDFTLFIDGNEVPCTVDDDEIIFSTLDLDYGSHTLALVYSGDSYFFPKNVTGTFNLVDVVVYIPQTFDMTTFNDSVRVKLPKDAYGKAVLKFKNGAEIDYSTFEEEDDEIEFTLELYDLKFGINDVQVVITGKYPTTKEGKINATYVLSFESSNLIYGNDKVFLNVPQDATGNVFVYVDGVRYNAVIDDDYGECYFKVPSNLSVGNHTVVIQYSGDSKYPAKEFNDVLCVVPQIIVPDTGYINTNDDEIVLKLPEDATGNLSVVLSRYVNGKPVPFDEKNITVVNGKAVYSFDKLTWGSYKLVVNYTGNYEVVQSCDEYYFKVNPQFNCPLTILEGSAEVISINVPGANGYLEVEDYDSSFNSRVRLVDGKASISLAKLSAGTHDLNVEFAHNYNVYDGDAFWEEEESYYTAFLVTVQRPVIKANNVAVYYNSGSSYKVRIAGADKKFIVGDKVTFKINGKVIGSSKIDKNGYASIKIKQKPGKYKITTVYKKASVTKKLTVKHVVVLKAVKVKRSAKKLVIKVTVKAGKKPLKGKVTLKFKNKKYKAKINKKGVAKFTIKKSVLKKLKAGKKVKYQATYLKDTVKRTVKVKK